MTVILSVPIQCGEDTCSVEQKMYAEHCKFFHWDIRGIASCSFFGKDLRDKDDDICGWILRCKQCKEAEK